MKMHAGDKVGRHDVDAATMVTIGPDHPAWADPLKLGDVDGSFVRLDPPANTPDEDVLRLKIMCSECGAVAVKALPVRKDAVVGLAVAIRQTIEAASPRALVMGLLAEARSRDPEALAEVVEVAMLEAGL